MVRVSSTLSLYPKPRRRIPERPSATMVFLLFFIFLLLYPKPRRRIPEQPSATMVFLLFFYFYFFITLSTAKEAHTRAAMCHNGTMVFLLLFVCVCVCVCV